MIKHRDKTLRSFVALRMTRIDAIFIFIIGILFFTYGLNTQEIIGFESRFYLFALEMWRHGPTWFPTTYQHPYPDYPGTSTFLIYLTSSLLGQLNKLTAVLPSAIASALTLSMTYLTGALFSRRYGWCAVFFLLFTIAFVTATRTISLDAYVSLVTVSCFYFVAKQSLNHQSRSPLLFIMLLLVCAFAVRGPIGLVIPTGVVCICYLLDKKYKSFFITGILATVVLMSCCVVLLALAYHVGGESFVQDVLRMEVAGRMHDLRTPPRTFYLTESIGAYAVSYPLMLLMLPGCVVLFCKSTSSDVKFLQKCFAWLLVIVIGLSIPADKKIRYILPLAPALALICAYLFAYPERNRYLSYVRKAFSVFCFILPSICLLALAFLHQKNIEINYFILAIIFVVIQAFNIYLRKNAVAVLALAVLTFMIVNVGIVETINLTMNRTRDFVLQVETLRQKNQASFVFYKEGADGLPIKYLAAAPHEVFPIYLDQENDLLKLKLGTVVVMDIKNKAALSPDTMSKLTIIMQGRIGHDDVVIMSPTSRDLADVS